MVGNQRMILAAAVALTPLLWSLDLAAQSADAPEIQVTANGTATLVPNRATVVIEVRTESSTPSEAAARNSPIMQAVLDTLRRMGHQAESINTRGYTVQPTYRYDPSGPTPTGFAAANAVTLRLERVSELGTTLDAVLAAGATRIGSVRFESSDYDRVRREALERAVAAARQDGEALARAAGGLLGELISLSTDARPTREEYVMAAASSIYPRTGETPINVGDQAVVATVQTRWHFVKR